MARLQVLCFCYLLAIAQSDNGYFFRPNQSSESLSLYKMSYGALVTICLAVFLVRGSRCYEKPEPPETHFFLKDRYRHGYLVFFTESTSTEPELLCVEEAEAEDQQLDLELLAHLICTESKYPTFTSVQTSESEVSILDIMVNTDIYETLYSVKTSGEFQSDLQC